MIKINCNKCDNPFGELNKFKIKIDYKRVNNIELDTQNKRLSVKCRKCAHYSTIGFEEKVINEIDYKKTGVNLL